MLEPRHIIRLQLDRNRKAAHDQMPLPEYVTKPLIGQFTTLSDTILTTILGIDPDTFKRQLDTARKMGAAFISEDVKRRPVGISATTSLIKSGNVMTKNLIIPQDFMRFDRKLADHMVIGAFIRGQINNGSLAYDDSNIEVAGWTTFEDIQRLQAAVQPPTFQSKLRIIMVPCTSLRPIGTLIEQLRTDGIKL